MKKLILACALLAISLEASAGSMYFGPTLFIQTNTSSDDNYRGLHPRLSVGYWDVYDCFYLAGELYVVPATVSISESNDDRAESARTTADYGVSFLPGLLITETVVAYLRVGYNASRFYGPDVTKSGGQFGAGIQSSLSENWSIRVEYLYTAYSNVSTIGSPKSDQYGLGLIYKLQ
jgi:opacity protein-like surface antigen